MKLLAEFLELPVPEKRIALHPPANRSDARMLVVDRRSGELAHHHVRDISKFVEPGDLWVFNQTRVRKARTWLAKANGGKVELLWLRPDPEPHWLVWGQTSRLRHGDKLSGPGTLAAEVLAINGPFATVRVDSETSMERWLEIHGEVPLPPYIRRNRDVPVDGSDAQRYQTIFATQPGSIAAPTAGLHFDERLLAAMTKAGARTTRITLHVGPGTFTEVSPDQVDNVQVAPELAEIPDDAAQALSLNPARVVPVGTTALRTLEGLLPKGVSPAAVSGEVDLTIRPGVETRWAGAFLTNFHLPNTSLRLLVAAVAGPELAIRAYREALAEPDYRFFSYGDCMFII